MTSANALLREAHLARLSRAPPATAALTKPRERGFDGKHRIAKAPLLTPVGWTCTACASVVPSDLGDLETCPFCDARRTCGHGSQSLTHGPESKTMDTRKEANGERNESGTTRITDDKDHASVVGWTCTNPACGRKVAAELQLVEWCPYCRTEREESWKCDQCTFHNRVRFSKVDDVD